MTLETGVGTPCVLLEADAGGAPVAIEFAINNVESGLVFVKAHLEIHRLAFIFAGRYDGCEVGDTPLDVEDAVRGIAADRGEDAAAGGVCAQGIRESENGVVEEAIRHATYTP